MAKCDEIADQRDVVHSVIAVVRCGGHALREDGGLTTFRVCDTQHKSARLQRAVSRPQRCELGGASLEEM